ncbi:porphobilinogen deaminase [Auriscalpium vulgare]|uniref:Porphobilinogen deaminase n=1 Tax=Auriscalpium vulgare TaxID=40419 RepID=A0ACB8RJ19_9AGAM|nr:porphobilinogen deaminase [Auriscalpium vulgare]
MPVSGDDATRTFVLASRASALAQIQTNIVLDALRAAFPARAFDTSFMSTQGDKNQAQALYILGGKSLWTKELEVALLDGTVDMLVHSLKDVPTTLPPGCVLGAILEREDPVDSLVVKQGLEVDGKAVLALEDLPHGAVVGTSSVRRVAQLKRKFPHLVFKDVRGNLNTRLAKLDDPAGPYAALILAKAGLVRLGFGGRVTADLAAPTLYHAVGQGALGVEVRADDAAALALCRALTHEPTLWRCAAERACLRVLEGGCSVPVGVDSALDGPTLSITGTITAIDGTLHVQHELAERVGSVEDAEALGAKLARVLVETGGREILDAVAVDRASRGAAEDKTEAEVHKIEAAMQSAV